jgi:hypothetical protein
VAVETCAICLWVAALWAWTTTLWTRTAIATRWTLWLYITLWFLLQHLSAEFELTSLLVNLHEFDSNLITLLDASLFHSLIALPIDLRDVEQALFARHELYEAAIRHDRLNS